MFTYVGWEDGMDCDPPEPGKYWLTIQDLNEEEYAVIVYRTPDGKYPREDDPVAKERIDRAEFIVDSLNNELCRLGG